MIKHKSFTNCKQYIIVSKRLNIKKLSKIRGETCVFGRIKNFKILIYL